MSYPALIAQELGWQQFRYPIYGAPGDGLPLNLERLVRELEQRFGNTLDNFASTSKPSEWLKPDWLDRNLASLNILLRFSF